MGQVGCRLIRTFMLVVGASMKSSPTNRKGEEIQLGALDDTIINFVAGQVTVPITKAHTHGGCPQVFFHDDAPYYFATIQAQHRNTENSCLCCGHFQLFISWKALKYCDNYCLSLYHIVIQVRTSYLPQPHARRAPQSFVTAIPWIPGCTHGVYAAYTR